jgi:hypothetical protein
MEFDTLWYGTGLRLNHSSPAKGKREDRIYGSVIRHLLSSPRSDVARAGVYRVPTRVHSDTRGPVRGAHYKPFDHKTTS